MLELSRPEGRASIMIQETIAKIETQLQKSSAGAGDNRAELLGLLGTLKAEIAELSKTDAEQAQSIAGFAAVVDTVAMPRE